MSECSQCDGTGKVMCENCDGSGRVTLVYVGPDDTFEGTKLFTQDPFACHDCDGTGKVVCPSCGGSGDDD